MKTVFCALLLTFCVPAPAKEPHLAKVDDQVYRGRQPKKEDFPELAKRGIHTILDLRGGPIHGPHERRIVEAAGMKYITIRLSGLFPPKQRQIEKILGVLDDPANAPVFIHCRRGDDRVGMVIACYRMQHDHWTNAQAMAEAEQNHISPLE